MGESEVGLTSLGTCGGELVKKIFFTKSKFILTVKLFFLGVELKLSQ